MNYEDFIKPTEEPKQSDTSEIEPSMELDVQKAVVESLAADKAEQNMEIDRQRAEIDRQHREIDRQGREISELRKQNNELISKVSDLKETIEQLRQELLKVGDILSKNSEVPKSNQVTLLERNPDLEDRFEGETRDHVLEVLKEARDASEAEGRARRAQLLESVLVANESSGNLAKKREALTKLFNDNQNVINGQVINELDKMNITYKLGEKYLLVGEIIKRAY